MEEAVTADRVVVMGQGRILMQGRPEEIFIHVEKLKELGLDVPVAADVALKLREHGLKLPETIITDDELAVALCP